MAKVIFLLEGKETYIQCSKEDKMKDICNKYASKIDININLLLFLYGGNKINLELTFREQVNSIDNNINEMKILVYKQDDGLKCPKCGEIINIDILDIKENENDILNGLKNQIENIINLNDINKIKNQIKCIKIVIDNIILENEKYKNNIKNIINNYNKKNIIKGIIEIDNNNNKDILLFNKYNKGIDVYLNNERINNNIIKSNNNLIGQYEFKIIFNDNGIINLNGLFEKCYNLISIDISNFNSSNITDMSYMFNKCHKLKEIKGLNNFNTNKVTNMKAIFQACNVLEYLDLSNFNTSNVTDMSVMFFNCNKLKEIKGLNNFNTNKVSNMKAMFYQCNVLEYLDISNFNTSNVTDMSYMFNKCHKLKEIKGLNNFNTNKVTNMKAIFQACNVLEYLDLSNFNTSNVTDMSVMFFNCNKLKEIKGLNNFNTNKVTNMKSMFYQCNKLKNIDLSKFIFA